MVTTTQPNALNQPEDISSLSFDEARTLLFKRLGHAGHKLGVKSNSPLVINSSIFENWTYGTPQQKR